MRKLLILAVLAIGVGGGAAVAHHGWSSYDAATVVTIEAPIVTAKYENPHSEITLSDQAGKEWHVILAPPSRMERRGLARAELKPGTRATVVGYANRNKPEEMRAERITIGGKTVELR